MFTSANGLSRISNYHFILNDALSADSLDSKICLSALFSSIERSVEIKCLSVTASMYAKDVQC